jgi:hypothetical protein
MLEAENNEVKEMDRVKNDIQNLEPNGVEKAADEVEQQESKAIKNEDVQQEQAMAALQEVKKIQPVLDKLKDQPKDSSLFKAGQKIEEVSSTLQAGTKTSNTQKLLKKMATESNDIANAVKAPTLLGESREDDSDGVANVDGDDSEEQAVDDEPETGSDGDQMAADDQADSDDQQAQDDEQMAADDQADSDDQQAQDDEQTAVDDEQTAVDEQTEQPDSEEAKIAAVIDHTDGDEPKADAEPENGSDSDQAAAVDEQADDSEPSMLGESGVLTQLNQAKQDQKAADQKQAQNDSPPNDCPPDGCEAHAAQPEVNGMDAAAGSTIPAAQDNAVAAAEERTAAKQNQPQVTDGPAHNDPNEPAAPAPELSPLDKIANDRKAIGAAKEALAADERAALEAELPEEARVEDAEQRAMSEIKGLVTKLN